MVLRELESTSVRSDLENMWLYPGSSNKWVASWFPTWAFTQKPLNSSAPSLRSKPNPSGCNRQADAAQHSTVILHIRPVRVHNFVSVTRTNNSAYQSTGTISPTIRFKPTSTILFNRLTYASGATSDWLTPYTFICAFHRNIITSRRSNFDFHQQPAFEFSIPTRFSSKM